MHVSHIGILCERLRPFLPATAGPRSRASLEHPGNEISPFLRCYWYLPGDCSKPHYDKQWCQYSSTGDLLTFSAYSLLLYVTDNADGGSTTFFEHDSSIRMSCSGLTPLCSRDSLVVAQDLAVHVLGTLKCVLNCGATQE
eukprot:1948197-Amphidinium_carterae.1